MKTLIDANVILRYILDDDEAMSEKAAIVIQNGAFTLPEIIAEVVYVLSKVYNVTREDIASYIGSVLNDVDIERRDIMLFAVKTYSETKLDFVDCILVAYNKIDNLDVFSFDKKLNHRLEME